MKLSTWFASLAATFALVSLAAPALADTPPAARKAPPPAAAVTVQLADAKGAAVGTAKLTQVPTGVAIALDVHGLTPGQHAIHVHETAKCTAPDFKSAGGHFNPDHKQHGAQNAMGPHAGDMPNFTVDDKGNSKETVIAPGVTIDAGAHSIYTGGGTALVIHAKADDMKTDPAGNAGDRIACGTIAK